MDDPYLDQPTTEQATSVKIDWSKKLSSLRRKLGQKAKCDRISLLLCMPSAESL
ncbi:MAG: hypothetical protein HQK57_08015 [Deltaproteobacteria bacterium]|nr:hypothetical protein [Deltaproteobacteria bacterium]MBF0508855.1 hypothetical protein [Deltaproteobacteria bacterium]